MIASRTYLFARASVYKALILMRRYLFNTVSQIFTGYLFFAVLFFGGQQIAPAAMAQSIAGIIVGYFLWMLVMSSYSSIAGDITREAQWGTLEQLYMSPLGIAHVVGIKTVVNVMVSMLVSGVLLGLMLVTTGTMLAIDLLTVVPLVALTLAPAVGLGYVFGGLALLYKRVENAFRIMQFVFIGLIAAPLDRFPLLKFAPFSLGSDLLRDAMQNGTRIWELPVEDVGLLVGLGLFYLLAGYLAFQRIQYVARRRGVLGDY
jgi:ABC-2 type transport system permease protein